jgi:eukaryotic-like serine/threonine-protein kinase
MMCGSTTPQRDAMTRLTAGQIVRSPTWSPDGHHVVFSVVGAGIFQARADGASGQQVLTVGQYLIPSSFTPDGHWLSYLEPKGDKSQIRTVAVTDHGGQLEAGLPEPFLNSDFSDSSPSFSPDGRWLAYQSDESGRSEMYVRAFPPPSSGQGGEWLIFEQWGCWRWSRSGHELVYQSDDQLLAVSYTVRGDTFDAAKPQVWIHQLGGTSWDLAPDGKRAAVPTPVATAETPKQEHEVVFLQNFFDELRRRVPVAR